MIKLFNFRQKYTLSYIDFGNPNGFPILIQHGLIASIKDRHLFKSLADANRRVISIARPGYGESTPYGMKNIAEWGEIISIFVAQLRLTAFDIFGISSGAPYSYAIANKLSHCVRNIYILSGTPALYDKDVQKLWPYPLNQNASISDLQQLARSLFFSDLSKEDLEKDDIKDSMKNNCFGIAQDLKIRCVDWGFNLREITSRVIMRHSKVDGSVPFATADLTAKLLPNCKLEAKEKDTHFSKDIVENFIEAILKNSPIQ